jgi:hypothetical protein
MSFVYLFVYSFACWLVGYSCQIYLLYHKKGKSLSHPMRTKKKRETNFSWFFNSCQTAGVLLASQFSFYPSSEQWVTDQMGPTADIDTVVMKNIFFHRGK